MGDAIPVKERATSLLNPKHEMYSEVFAPPQPSRPPQPIQDSRGYQIFQEQDEIH
jgi:hypothetical protein